MSTTVLRDVLEQLNSGNYQILSSQARPEQQVTDSLGFVVKVKVGADAYAVKTLKPTVRQDQKYKQSFNNQLQWNQRIFNKSKTSQVDKKLQPLIPFMAQFVGEEKNVHFGPSKDKRVEPFVASRIMVSKVYGDNLENSLINRRDPRWTLETLNQLKIRLRNIMDVIRKSGFCHGDLELRNFMVPSPESQEPISNVVFFDLDLSNDNPNYVPSTHQQRPKQKRRMVPILDQQYGSQIVDQQGNVKMRQATPQQQQKLQLNQALDQLCFKDKEALWKIFMQVQKMIQQQEKKTIIE